GDDSRRRALGRVHEVVWETGVDGDAVGLSSTYHQIVIPGYTARPGSLGRVRATELSGDRLLGVPA
ncbi:MAG: hypothetical protein ACREQ5_10270, partial [Candidatus Dormibacteria bacterium]